MLVFVGLLCEVLESYMCPKKKKAAAPPPAEEKEPLTATGVVDEEEMRDVKEIELNGSSKPGYAKAGLNGHK